MGIATQIQQRAASAAAPAPAATVAPTAVPVILAGIDANNTCDVIAAPTAVVSDNYTVAYTYMSTAAPATDAAANYLAEWHRTIHPSSTYGRGTFDSVSRTMRRCLFHSSAEYDRTKDVD